MLKSLRKPEGSHFDVIIAGAGAAGLYLAYRICQKKNINRRILLIDNNLKDSNDRTWCFWEESEGKLDHILYRRWNKLRIKTPDMETVPDIAPFSYKMIKGVDFYTHMMNSIKECENMYSYKGNIETLRNTPKGVYAKINDMTFTADIAFNSIPNADYKKHITLYQHFKGYTIETEKDIFDPEVPDFMNFCTDQKKYLRFFYILPFNPKKALIEYTIFSPELLKPSEYDDEIKKYISGDLKINNYKILDTEFGVIPMTTYKFKKKEGKHIFNIGAAGGWIKASTGYTFKNILENTESIVSALSKQRVPRIKYSNTNRWSFYDRLLIKLIYYNYYPAYKIFEKLFKKNKIQLIFRFLDNRSTFLQDIKIISGLPPKPFLKALFK